MEEHHIAEHLRRLLPREEGRAVEKPAEAALRKRMCALCLAVLCKSSAVAAGLSQRADKLQSTSISLLPDAACQARPRVAS